MVRRLLILILTAALAAGCAESSLLRGTATDTVPPTVVATEPARGAENVGEGRISITFSEPMSTGSVTLQASPSLEWGAGTWSNGDRTLTFIPADIRPNTQYSIVIAGRDRAGNAMAQPFTLQFRTGSNVQAGAGAALQHRVEATGDERVYAAFLALIVSGNERVLQALPEEQRQLRETISSAAPEPARKIREYFASRQISAAQLTEYALWLTPELRLSAGPPVGTGPSPAASPTPAVTAPPPAASPTPAARPTPAAPPARGTPAAITPRPQPEWLRQFPELDVLLRELYTEGKGRDHWQRASADHERVAAEYRTAAQDRVRQVVTYLRVPALPTSRIVIVPNLLAARDSVENAQVNGTLYVVVGPSAAPNFRGVTQALVRVVAGPIVAGLSETVDRSKALYDLVKDEAQARGWRSWEEVVRESLVRAVEARLMLPNAEEQTQYMDTVFSHGLVLARHFAGRLPALERGEAALARVVQDALGAVNVEQIRQQWANRRR